MEDTDMSSLNADDILSTIIDNLIMSTSIAENHKRSNSLDDGSRYSCIDFDELFGSNYSMDTIIKWANEKEESNAIIKRGLYQKAAELSLELRCLQVTDSQLGLQLGESVFQGVIDPFAIPAHSLSQGIELCYQSKFSGCAFCSLLEFYISMEKSVVSSLSLNNIGLRNVLNSYGNQTIDVSEMEDDLHNKIFTIEEKHKIFTIEEKHNKTQSTLEAYTVQLLEKFYEAPFFPSIMSLKYISKCENSIDPIAAGSLNSSSEKCVVFKLSFAESSLKTSSITELLSSCDRLFISLPCLFVINVCRDLPYTHFDARHDGEPKDFSFDLLSSVCATGVEINGRISKYDLVAFIYTECSDENSFETRCVSFRVENGSKHWYRKSSRSVDEIDAEDLYACFTKSFLLAYKQRCY